MQFAGFARREIVTKAEKGTRNGPRTRDAPAHREILKEHGGSKKTSVIRRVARAIWVSPRHAVLALVTGVLCGGLAARIGGIISPPYTAILGTLVFYPVLVALWSRLPLQRRRSR
jgi:hypothetical protein